MGTIGRLRIALAAGSVGIAALVGLVAGSVAFAEGLPPMAKHGYFFVGGK
jgi:hypothetical protein